MEPARPRAGGMIGGSRFQRPEGRPSPRASQTRRHFLRNASLAVSFFVVPGAFAEELLRQTPWVPPGPLYPEKLPLDTDNDLIIVSNSITPAVGEITHL